LIALGLVGLQGGKIGIFVDVADDFQDKVFYFTTGHGVSEDQSSTQQ
jgi:hypothetical protein